MMVSDAAIVMQLPWTRHDSDQLFKKILMAFLVAFLVIAIPVSITKVPDLTRADKERLPPQLARVVLTQQQLQPPPVVEKPKVEKK
jgi:periplasmic protein TonB